MEVALKPAKIQTSQELLAKTEQLIYLRFAIAGAGFVIYACLALIGSYAFDTFGTGLVIGMVIFYGALALVLIRALKVNKRRHLNLSNAILTFLDIVCLTLLVGFTMGLESDLYVLYLLPILLSSYTFGKKGTYLTALGVSVSYVGLLVVENASSLSYLFQSGDNLMESVYVSKLWSRILGRSLLLVSVSFIWARFCGYMSDVALQGANRLREQLEQNNLMVAEMQTRSQREHLINSINSALRSTLEFDDMLATAVEELAQAVGVFRCAIVCRLSERGDDIVVREANVDSGSKRAKLADLVNLDDTICGYLLQKKAHYEELPDGTVLKTFVYSSPGEDSFFEPVKGALDKAGYGSLVVQPMIYAGDSKGVIVIAEMDPRRHWSETELELIKSVAGQVAVAVEQETLIEELSRKNEDLQKKNLNLDAKNSELRAMQSQLIHQEKMASLGRLVAGIAHELNNPINFVHGNLPYLSEYVNDMKRLIDSMEELPESERAAFDDLKEKVKYQFLVTDLDNIIADLNEGSDRIRHIVRNLKSFSRLDEAELKEASINEGIESTLKILSQYFGRDKIPVDRELADLPAVLCYPGQLNQVWMNLLSNAGQAVEEMPEGRVGIKTECKNGRVTVTIRDNGPGIKPEIQSKIFDPFFTTKPVGQGTGLGLSICHSIVERHGGQISVSSQPGEGTKFSVTIPLKGN
ncbi:MAG: GAF domain-containing protein [Cyanobacteria bacterium HKST-UBA02]|nr:GAF domain-containing protein [Cyanobacteria bacterium HKST-UBA02]